MELKNWMGGNIFEEEDISKGLKYNIFGEKRDVEEYLKAGVSFFNMRLYNAVFTSIYINLQAIIQFKKALNNTFFIPEIYSINFAISECYYFLV